ncbi:MAG: exonuclease SbcCD subunit D [Vicinamibacterales bacterium]
MLHQFAHGGDLHLGPNDRNKDRRAAFDTFIAEGLALERLAAWCLPGDLNHARMTIEDRNYLADRLRAMADLAPVLIVRGNHDIPGDLDIFARLRAAWPVYVATTPGVVSVPLATGATASVFCLPYPTEAGLVSAGAAPGDVVQNARVALEAIFMEAGHQFDAARVMGEIPIALGHVNVAGSITATGQPNIGQEIEVDAALIALLGPCYVGLNHIHKGQQIGGAWYPGSFCRLDWGEIDPKRWLLVSYAENPSDVGGYTVGVEARPLAVAPLYHVEGVLTRDTFDWVVKAASDGAPIEAPASWAGCEVRVRYRFNASEKALLEHAKSRILAEFAEAARLELEPVAVPDRALRAPEVAAARSLADKVEAWAELSGAVVTEGVVEKLAALEHGDPATVLAGVRERADAVTRPAGDREAAA